MLDLIELKEKVRFFAQATNILCCPRSDFSSDLLPDDCPKGHDVSEVNGPPLLPNHINARILLIDISIFLRQ